MKQAPSALSFSQADIDGELRRGSGYGGGKLRIYAMYQHQPDTKTAVAFLKDEYNWYGHSHTFMDGSSGFINYSPKGMKLDHYKPAYEKTLKWNAVEKRLRTLIAEDSYLTESEKAQYAEIEREYAGFGGVPMPVARMGFPKPKMPVAEKSETIWDYNDIKHICRVEFHEALEAHIQIGGGFVELFPFPCLRLPLGLKAPLLGLLALAVPVGIAVDRPPCVGLFFLVDCHQLPLLSFSP